MTETPNPTPLAVLGRNGTLDSGSPGRPLRRLLSMSVQSDELAGADRPATRLLGPVPG